MNIAPLRKAIIKEVIFFSIIAMVFGAGAFYLDGRYEESSRKKSQVVTSVNQTVEEKRKIEAQYGVVRESLPLFRESMRYSNMQGLFIDSQAVRDLFNQYQSKYLLKKISVEMQPITELSSDPIYTRKNFIAVRSNVKITMEALSDEDIYTLMQMLQRELPGFVRVKSFSVSKKQDLSKQILATIRKEGSASMITSEMVFDWYGMKSTDPQSDFNRYVPVKREGMP